MNLDEAKAIIVDINKTVSKLDGAVRARAFELLSDIAFDGEAVSSSDGSTGGRKKKPIRRSGRSSSSSSSDLGGFISQFEHDKPSDNLKLLIAWLYSQYGKYPMSLDSLKNLAKEAGLTIPEKPAMTLKTAAAKKKPMFQSPKRGHYQVTTSGELALKEKYGVTKGTKAPPTEDDE